MDITAPATVVGSESFKYEKLRDEFIRNIENGDFDQQRQLPSISKLCVQYNLSRVTVERAFRYLKGQGYVQQIKGKGFFINEQKTRKLNVLMVLNSWQAIHVYKSFKQTTGHGACIQIQVYDDDVAVLETIIKENFRKFDHYVIMLQPMPNTTNQKLSRLIQKLPNHRIFLLGEKLSGLGNGKYAIIYHELEMDIYKAMCKLKERFSQYKGVKLIVSESNNFVSQNIKMAIEKFCHNHDLAFACTKTVAQETLTKGTVYIAIDDEHLYGLVKSCQETDLHLSSDFGLIGFEDNKLKELFEITV